MAELTNFNDYQLQMMLQNIESEGHHAKAMMQAGQAHYAPKYHALRDRWKAIKAELGRRASGQAAAPAPGLAAAAEPAKLSPGAYHDMLAGHDWNYSQSDAPGAYRAGRESEDRIHGAASRQPELMPLLQGWKRYAAGHTEEPPPRPIE